MVNCGQNTTNRPIIYAFPEEPAGPGALLVCQNGTLFIQTGLHDFIGAFNYVVLGVSATWPSVFVRQHCITDDHEVEGSNLTTSDREEISAAVTKLTY